MSDPILFLFLAAVLHGINVFVNLARVNHHEPKRLSPVEYALAAILHIFFALWASYLIWSM